MMRRVAIALALCAGGVGSAHATLLNWQLDPDGAGAAGRVTINEFLDIGNSVSYVSTTAPSGGSFNFNENGVAQFTGHDGTSNFGSFNGQLTSTFTITGSGTLGGALNYAGGTINIYSGPAGAYATTAGTYGADQGTLIGSFQVIGGSGQINTSGEPNGLQTVNARATNLAAGYFFNSTGQDLSTQLGSNLVFGLATTNASRLLNPSGLAQSEIPPGGAVFTNCLPGQTTGNCTGVGSFFISNNGQFRLDTQVSAIPEPSTYALLAAGLGMIGFMARRRRSL